MTVYAKFKPVQSPRWALVTSALPNLNIYEALQITKDSSFQNAKFPCANLNPLFKTFWRRFWLLNLTSFHLTV